MGRDVSRRDVIHLSPVVRRERRIVRVLPFNGGRLSDLVEAMTRRGFLGAACGLFGVVLGRTARVVHDHYPWSWQWLMTHVVWIDGPPTITADAYRAYKVERRPSGILMGHCAIISGAPEHRGVALARVDVFVSERFGRVCPRFICRFEAPFSDPYMRPVVYA